MTLPDSVSPSPRRGAPGAGPFTSTGATLLMLAAAFPMRFHYRFAVFGSFTLLDVVLAVLGIALGLRMLAAGQALRTGDGKVAFLLAVPFVICISSLVWTDDRAATFRQIGIFVEPVVAYWVAVNILYDISVERAFSYLAIFVVLLLLGSALSLAQVPGFEPPSYGLQQGTRDYYTFLAAYYARLGHPFYGLSNDFASVLSLFVLPLLAWGVVKRSPRYLFLSAVTFSAEVLTQSRGVLAATLLGGLVFLAAQGRRLLRWLPAVTVGLATVLVVGYFYYRVNETVQVYLGDRLQITTIEARKQILTAGWRQLAESPVLGYGGGVVAGGDPLLVDGVHNAYLQQMLYYGVPLGVATTGALWLLALRLLRWRVPLNDAARLVALSMGLSVFVQLVAFLGETSFEATLPKTTLYFLMAFAVAILRQFSRDIEPVAI